MGTEITKEDLRDFKINLVAEIRLLLNTKAAPLNKWLRSSEVRKLLNISPNTLQNFRVNGTLSYTRLGGIMYYRREEIERLLEENAK